MFVSDFCSLSWGSLCPGQPQLILGLRTLLCVWAPLLGHPWCLPRTIHSILPLGFWPAFLIQRTLLLAASQPGEPNLEKFFPVLLQGYFAALGVQYLWKQNAWFLLEYDLVQPLKKTVSTHATNLMVGRKGSDTQGEKQNTSSYPTKTNTDVFLLKSSGMLYYVYLRTWIPLMYK